MKTTLNKVKVWLIVLGTDNRREREELIICREIRKFENRNKIEVKGAKSSD